MKPQARLGKKMTQPARVSKGGESGGEVVKLLWLLRKRRLCPQAWGRQEVRGHDRPRGLRSALSPLPPAIEGPLLTKPGTFHSVQQAQSGHGQPPWPQPRPMLAFRVPDLIGSGTWHPNRTSCRICKAPCSKIIKNFRMVTVEY